MRRPCLILLALSLAACGVQRPLMKPADIPAYEAAKQRKRDKMAQDEQQLQQQNAADAAGEKAIEDAQ
jgi:hypothetical protein